jgi:hypothetical protein
MGYLNRNNGAIGSKAAIMTVMGGTKATTSSFQLFGTALQ